MSDKMTNVAPVEPSDEYEESKAKDKPCTKMLPYVSPRVVIRIPDIHRGLNQTVVSISDSDPCSPCDMTFRDISKTLCSPRTLLPDSVTKARIKPSAAIRKVDVINQSFEMYEKHLSALEESIEPDKDTPADVLEEIIELENENNKHSSHLMHLPMSQVTDKCDQHVPLEGLFSSPITFYSSPKFHTIHWSQNGESHNGPDGETEVQPQQTQATITNELSQILNTPPITCNDLFDHLSEDSNSLYSDRAYKCLDMKSPPNVNIFGDGVRMNHKLKGSEDPTQIVSHYGADSINEPQLTINPIVQARMVTSGLEAHSSEMQLGKAKTSTREFNSSLKPGNHCLKSSLSHDENVHHPKISHLKRRYQRSNTSSSDEESLQTSKRIASSKRNVLSSCRSYRQYKQLKKRNSKQTKKIKDFITPYTVDQTKIHAPYHAKIPNYNYNNVNLEVPNLYGSPQLKNGIPDETSENHLHSISSHGQGQMNLEDKSFNIKMYIHNDENDQELSNNSSVSSTNMHCGVENAIVNSISSCQHMATPAAFLPTPHLNVALQAKKGSCLYSQEIQLNHNKNMPYHGISQAREEPVGSEADKNNTHSSVFSSVEPATCTALSYQTLSGMLPEQIQPMAYDLWSHLTTPTMLDPEASEGNSDLLPNTVRNIDKTVRSNISQRSPQKDKEADTMVEKGVNKIILPKVSEFLIPSAASSQKNPNIHSFSYPLKALRIGSFKYLPFEHTRHRIAVLQIKTSHRLLIYELELHQAKEDEQKRQWPFALIEIPFESISNLRQMNGTALIIEVNVEPSMFMGYRQCDKMGKMITNSSATYKDRESIDSSMGQLGQVPYHEIELYSDCAQYIVNTLAISVEHLPSALRKEMVIEPQKQLKSCTSCGDVQGKQLTSIKFGLDETPAKSSYVCQCTQGCQLPRCGCQFRTQACSELCRCHRVLNNCENPNNVCDKLKISLERVKRDQCLMANLPKVLNADFSLERSIKFPCCGREDNLKSCCLGRITCPSCSESSLKYSWCLDIIYNEEVEPIFHCQQCKKCTEKNMYHCEICKRCHTAKEECRSEGDDSHNRVKTDSSPQLSVGLNKTDNSSTNIQTMNNASLCVLPKPTNQILPQPGKTEINVLRGYKGLTFNLSNVGLAKNLLISASSNTSTAKAHRSLVLKNTVTQSSGIPVRILNTGCTQTTNSKPRNDDMLTLPLAVISDDEDSIEDCREIRTESIVPDNTSKPGLNMLTISDSLGLDFSKPLCTSSPIHSRITK